MFKNSLSCFFCCCFKWYDVGFSNFVLTCKRSQELEALLTIIFSNSAYNPPEQKKYKAKQYQTQQTTVSKIIFESDETRLCDALKDLHHLTCLVRVVSWFTFVCRHWRQQRQTKRRNVQGTMDETDPLRKRTFYFRTKCLNICPSLKPWFTLACRRHYSRGGLSIHGKQRLKKPNRLMVNDNIQSMRSSGSLRSLLSACSYVSWILMVVCLNNPM